MWWQTREYFSYIEGFTSGGAAYGITWEEYRRIENEESIDYTAQKDECNKKSKKNKINLDDLPF